MYICYQVKIFRLYKDTSLFFKTEYHWHNRGPLELNSNAWKQMSCVNKAYTGTCGYIPRHGQLSPEANGVGSWAMRLWDCWSPGCRLPAALHPFWIQIAVPGQMSHQSFNIAFNNIITRSITSLITGCTDAFHELQCSTTPVRVTAWEVLSLRSLIQHNTAVSPRLKINYFNQKCQIFIQWFPNVRICYFAVGFFDCRSDKTGHLSLFSGIL